MIVYDEWGNVVHHEPHEDTKTNERKTYSKSIVDNYLEKQYDMTLEDLEEILRKHYPEKLI